MKRTRWAAAVAAHHSRLGRQIVTRPTRPEGLPAPTMAPTPASRAAHLIDLARSTVPGMHPGGRPVVAGIAASTLTLRALFRAVGLPRAGSVTGKLGLAVTAGCALFFRNPHRVPPTDLAAVVAPGDGTIAQITTALPPPETGLGSQPRPRISIFLSLLDVHVQRIPIAGRVRFRCYHPGAFLSADLDKASEDNERNSLVISPHVGDADVVVTQIAGLLARRIVCDVDTGATVRLGETYGLIRFGSRVDTYLPPGTVPLVRVGQRAVGGETVLARLGGVGG